MSKHKNSELMFQKYWKPGMLIKTYSDLIGCSKESAYNWLKRYHPEVIDAVVKLNSEENFQKYWRSGMSFATYGKIIGVSGLAVRNWMNLHHPEIVKVKDETGFNMGYKINEYLFDYTYKPGMALNDLAVALNCSEITLFNWCKKFRPEIHASFLKINPIRLTEELFQKYWKDGMTRSKFSKITGIHKSTVNWWLKKYHPEVAEHKLKVREELFQKYWEDGMSATKCSELIGIHLTTFIAWMKKYHPEIKIESKLINSEEKFQKYWRDGMTTLEYANIIGCSKTSAGYWLRRYHPEVCIPKNKKRFKDRNSEIPEKFRSFWTKDMTIETFAKICKLSYDAMQQWLYQNHPEVLFKHVFKRTEQHV